MYLTKFQTKQKVNNKIVYKNYFKFCRYPKKTKLYKSLMYQLNHDIIESFTYGNPNKF